MKIIVIANSQDLKYEEMVEQILAFDTDAKIDININGLKFKGRVSTIKYESTDSNRFYRTTKIVVETIE